MQQRGRGRWRTRTMMTKKGSEEEGKEEREEREHKKWRKKNGKNGKG